MNVRRGMAPAEFLPAVGPPLAIGDWASGYLPSWMLTEILGIQLWQWLGLLVLVLFALLAGELLQRVIVPMARAVARRTGAAWDGRLGASLPGPLRLFLAVLAFQIGVPALRLPPAPQASVDLWVRVVLIATA